MQVSRLSGVALMCAMLGACSPNIAADDQEPPLGDIPTITSPDQIALPIDAYLPSIEQSVARLLVGYDLVNTCIKSGGGQSTIQIKKYDDTGGESQPPTISELTHAVASYREKGGPYNTLWGFFNPDTVAHYGYAEPPTGASGMGFGGGDREDPVVASCLAQVDLMTPGGEALMPFMISQLPDGGPPRSTGGNRSGPASDSRFVAVAQEWSACMAQHGFDFATPLDALLDTLTTKYTDSEKELAKSVAIADVQCKLDTNLVGVAVAVQSAYDQRYIDDHRDALSEFQTKQADYIAGRVSAPSPSSEPT